MWLHFTLTSGLFQIRSSVVKSNNPEEYWLAIDTDTGKIIPAYVNAYKYFGGVTRIIQCDNLKTGVQKHGKDEVVLNKSYEKDFIAVAERLNKIMEDIDNVSEES